MAGSLVTNQVRGYDLLRMFGRDGHPTPLGQGFIEYGRIAKTLRLLALADPIDDSYQRRQNRQLTIQESRHRLARKICHGNRGQIHQPYREGQEDQLAALGQGAPLGFRTVAEVRAEMQSLGPWDGSRPTLDAGKAPKAPRSSKGAGKAGSFALATWKQLIDLGSMQDGEVHLRATGRRPVAHLSPAAYESVFGMSQAEDGHDLLATISGDRGSVTLPVVVADLPDDVVWVPARSFGRGVLAELASPGSPVTVKGASL